MQFCEKCGTRLIFRQVNLESRSIPALACEKCGSWTPIRSTVSKPEKPEDGKDSIKVVGEREKDLRTMPTIAAECPKCGNKEAYWWFLQTRSGDEPATQFYRCTKCDHTWRVYA